jgi:hypothetical protein
MLSDQRPSDAAKMVRYPSRRMVLQLLSDPSYGPYEPCKFVSMEIDLVPVKATMIPDARWLVSGSLLALYPNAAANVGSLAIPSAVDNMSPRHHFIRALHEIPVAPSITVNSIVAVEGDGPVEQANDGVVEYSTAHIEPVESELVAKSNLSTQGNSPHHRGGASYSPAASGSEDAHGTARAPMTAEDHGRETPGGHKHMRRSVVGTLPGP